MRKTLKAAAKFILKLATAATIAAAALVGDADAQQPTPKTEQAEAIDAAGRPAVTPPPTFIDYAVDNAVVMVRKLKKKAPSRIPGWLVDGVERSYRIYRNEQELKVWRGRARQIIADLALLAEALDAHVDETAAFQDLVKAEQAAITARLDALELRTSEYEHKLETLDRAATVTADDVTNLKKVVAILEARLAAQKPAATPAQKPATPQTRPPVIVSVPFRLPGDTLTPAERDKIFAQTHH